MDWQTNSDNTEDTLGEKEGKQIIIIMLEWNIRYWINRKCIRKLKKNVKGRCTRSGINTVLCTVLQLYVKQYINYNNDK